jgi:DNA topoisomerase-1
MAKAKIEKTVATITISGISEQLVATGEVLKFDGFLKVYLESTDDEQEDEGSKMLPPLKIGQDLNLIQVQATEKYTRPSARYTEASLVKRLEELGIGRPSTYAPTISTIQKRGYVVKEDREGKERNFVQLTLDNKNSIERQQKTEKFASEKSKLFPSDIGMIVTDFLSKHFEKIMDFGFTASVEEEFDKIARGQLVWNKMIEKFYGPFHATVTNTSETAERQNAERNLGIDPESGKPVLVRLGRYGPFAQIGENSDDEALKPRYASLRAGQLTETITLAEALDLFKLPRLVGSFEDKPIKAAIGRFGPYLMHDSKFISIPKTDDVFAIDEPRAIDLIEGKRISDANKLLKTFPQDEEIKILNGRWGPYIAKGKGNYKLAKTQKLEDLTYEMVVDIIAAEEKTSVKKAPTAAKKAAPKKVAAKKKVSK